MARDNPLISSEEREALIDKYGLREGRRRAKQLYNLKYRSLHKQTKRAEYQREYGSEQGVQGSRVRKVGYNLVDLTQVSTEKFVKRANEILSGRKRLVI
jgi:hypothetical protein